MRISNQMMTRMLSDNIQDNQTAIYNKEQQISSGKAIQKASDDPTVWSRLAGLHSEQSELEQFSRNSTLLEGRLLGCDLALSAVGDILQSASEIGTAGSDGTLSDQDREVLANQMDALLEELVSQANSTYNGKYQFGGVQTGTAPFEVTRNDDGQIESVSYVGASTVSLVEVADGVSLPSQLVGSDSDNGVLVSSDADVFAPLIEMRDHLLAGENLTETDYLSQVDAAFEQVVMGRASVGAYQENLEFISDIQGDREVFLEEMLSAEEDVDMAQAVTELTEKQTAYEAALAMVSKTMSISLLNYI